MITLMQKCRKGSVPALLAVVASLLAGPILAGEPQETVTVRAAALLDHAEHHARLAAFYRERAVLGSKDQIEYFTMANRCDWLAARERLAAVEAQKRG